MIVDKNVLQQVYCSVKTNYFNVLIVKNINKSLTIENKLSN